MNDIILSDPEEFDHYMKIAIVGNSNVGKTSLLMRYCDNIFLNEAKATIGMETKLQFKNIKDQNIKINLCDTAGSERFNSITNQIFQGAHGVILVYDVSNRDSFD